jgi:hypothetical protein
MVKMGERRNAHRMFVGKSLRKTPVSRLSRIREDNIKLSLRWIRRSRI